MVQTEEEERRAPARLPREIRFLEEGGPAIVAPWHATRRDGRTGNRGAAISSSWILGESMAMNGVGGRVSARPRRD